ncbi:MAG: cadherin-like beta sandwich domain-containing protein, partial [Bacilli bacterium]|nr:cadherin-like beta sandwich domain-containing protein [Bacilli bacterium]
MKKVLSIIAIALYMLIGIEQVNAEGDKYILDLIPYNVTTACDLEGDGGQACFEKYLKGELDSYRITNGKVAKDNIIMIIPEITPKTGSELTGIQVAILNDPKITTFYQSSYGAEYGTLKTSKANLGYVYDFFPTVTIMNGRDEIELQEWVSNGKPKVDKVSEGSFTSLMYNAGSNEDALAPLEKKTPLGATFYTINDNVTTEDIIFQYDPDRQETSISDVNGSNALLDEAEIRSVTLKITSSVSTDATLKELTATGSNNLAYPFTETFAPGKFEYYTIVPNVVDNIRFNGTPNDPKIQGATGLENISAATGISVLATSNGHDLNVGDNTVNIVVTAESGDTEVYKINVKRLSNDTTIKGVTGTNGVSFTSISNDPSVTNTTTVPYKTASTDITAEFNHEGATLKENLGTLTLNTDNENDTSTKFNIKVNSEECNYTDGSVPGLDETTCASATYPFEIIRTAPSKNVNLSELKVDNVTVPGFDPINDPDKVSFTLPDVSADKESVEVTATLADTLNTISGTGTHNLKVGDNAIKVTVLSEDGVTKKEYTINIKRLSNETKLAAIDGLKVESTPIGTLAPNFVNTFDSSMGNYTYTFPANIENIKVTATALDTNKASVSIIDMSTSETIDNSDKTLNTTSKTFTKDTKKVGVIVTAEDGSTRVYKIDFSR